MGQDGKTSQQNGTFPKNNHPGGSDAKTGKPVWTTPTVVEISIASNTMSDTAGSPDSTSPVKSPN